MIDVRKALLFAALLGGCASTPTVPPPERAKVCKFPLDPSLQFELQQNAEDFSRPLVRWPGWFSGMNPYVFYRVRAPDGPSHEYATRLWDAPERVVFGLDGPFRLENGKIPVFVCDTARRQYIQFGPSYLYCPDMVGGVLRIALSEHHPHPDGLELAPGNMPKNRVPTKVYLWNDDGCIDQINANWETTAYCVPDGTALPTIWCEPFKP